MFGHVVCLFQRLDGQSGRIEGDDLFSGEIVDRANAHVLRERVQMRLVRDVVKRIERRIFTHTGVEVSALQPRDGTGDVGDDGLRDLGTYLQSRARELGKGVVGVRRGGIVGVGEGVVGVRSGTASVKMSGRCDSTTSALRVICE